jgi:toxin YoeB
LEWTILFSRQALKDARCLKAANLLDRADRLLDVIRRNPLQNPPPLEKLTKELRGMYSRRINLQHRMVYEIFEDRRTVRINRMWGHYE